MTPQTKTSSDEAVWNRTPFSLTEQLKILLIFVDGLPFRSTQQGYPNRLDVGEASDLCGWPERHIHLLIHRALEEELIQADGERFFMSERVEQWETGDEPLNLANSQLPPYWELEDGPTSPQFEDDNTVFDVVYSLTRLLEGHSGSMDDQDIREELNERSIGEELFESVDFEFNKGTNKFIEMVYHLGFVDVLQEDESIDEVKINQRGERFVNDDVSSDGVTESDQDLPMILQPDGRIMVPLESPLEDFRRIHPFVLLTGIDNMIEYSIDQRSLVKAENEGWDTSAFYEFLESRTGSVPDTVQSLFEETQDEAEEVRIEDVHHLLTFEDGSTAAEAMRVLSNYQPERIDENRLILRSSSSADTIKKNLSRSGIRIQMATGLSREASPLKDIPEEENSQEG